MFLNKFKDGDLTKFNDPILDDYKTLIILARTLYWIYNESDIILLDDVLATLD